MDINFKTFPYLCMMIDIHTSTADATRRMVASAHGRPIICKPIGSPSLS